ncbi:nucleotidyltransferase domain-containing protein [Actinospica sp. MGRD01-02]|uniref:Nucleotidyltransferase domain-containing protein n=1 Tax=Actinospica acidithermotolerans TaxID=2828514 RepID=A0A941EHP7_9ACTN|nr:nucleotidyltransferase domain-containing protein [Actinospica acidithermotolerans]MBR7830707.1 nucleotidyltransferase domain-containing protein [Actinospica acidithermotolerans]
MLQLELIERVKAVCRADPGLDGALMYGSFAKGEADEHSDIEFWLFFTARGRPDPAEWCARIAPVSYLIRNEFGAHVAIFPQLVRGEFHFASVSHYGSLSTWPERGAPVDRMIVVDRSGRLERLLRALPERVSTPAAPGDAVSEYCDRFLNWVVLAYHLVERGELLRAWDALGHVQRHLLWMARLADRETAHWLTPSRAAEAELPPRTIEALVAATSAADLDGLRAALRAALAEGRRCWEAIGAPVPDALIEEISAALGG